MLNINALRKYSIKKTFPLGLKMPLLSEFSVYYGGRGCNVGYNKRAQVYDFFNMKRKKIK